MRKYEKPDMEILELMQENIITTSNTLNIEGAGGSGGGDIDDWSTLK